MTPKLGLAQMKSVFISEGRIEAECRSLLNFRTLTGSVSSNLTLRANKDGLVLCQKVGRVLRRYRGRFTPFSRKRRCVCSVRHIGK